MITLLLLAALAPAPAAPLTLEAARASTLARWQGQLEYRDYQADKWFGLPVTVAITDGGDGVTQLRTADFDDGPQNLPSKASGIVRITSVSLLDPVKATEYSTSFRKARVPDLQTASLALTAARDPRHWTLVETITGTDDNRPAALRLTTVRDGDTMVTLKEVDFTDDAKVEWLARNRTTLKRVAK